VFRRLLIANRGEIALRIARGCRELGVEPVMIYSEADRDAPWLDAAAEAVCVGPARAALSYLDQDAVLQAAEQTDCQAVHPGYGFLAENALFAARCAQQGVTWVGPPASAIRAMGDKAEAKRSIKASGLPTIPGSDDVLSSVDEARRCAADAGYPVLLKATAGGGGKGMRRCDSEAELESAYAQASLEAGKAFGNASLYLEKLILGGRHIEFQLLCDGFGYGLHLGERECSIQRQHQKLVEESPSPVVTQEERDEMGGKIARALSDLGYRNAGTVEFLRGPEGNFYFMEVNTRLQVEHPVTEMCTGLDLVVRQLEVAANVPLDIEQSDVRFRGHAIEFRINAEDPAAGFRPDPGRIDRFRPPEARGEGVSVRWDSAVREGYRIPPNYDSMIGKLIVHAPDREAAMEGAREALSGMVIEGIKTTIPFHLWLLSDPGFRKGVYNIDHLADLGPVRTGGSGPGDGSA
jgi:acetyl-CoA carboxylase biotin carboxylase subunit